MITLESLLQPVMFSLKRIEQPGVVRIGEDSEFAAIEGISWTHGRDSLLARGRFAAEVTRLSRFLVVGGTSTAVDFGLFGLLRALGLPTLLANTLSFSTGVVVNFLGNRQWTFAETRAADWRGQLLRFGAVSLTGLGLNNGLVWLFADLFGRLAPLAAYRVWLAKLLATGVVVLWNYFAHRCWTFRRS